MVVKESWVVEICDEDRVTLRRYMGAALAGPPDEVYRPVTLGDAAVSLVAIMAGFDPPKQLQRQDAGWRANVPG